MLNCLTTAVPARERVITCEEVFEPADSPPPCDLALSMALLSRWALRAQGGVSG
jgi:hypothetical protein